MLFKYSAAYAKKFRAFFIHNNLFIFSFNEKKQLLHLHLLDMGWL